MWYRAPELVLGDSEWAVAIDAWSLGCLGVELVQRTAIFPATDQVDLLRRITTVFGTPRQGGGLSQLPLAKRVPTATTPTWPLASMRSEHLLLDILTGLLDIEPATRMSCAKAEAPVAASAAPHVVWAKVAMERGPFSLTHGHLEDHVLQWLQADPYWSELGRRAADHQKTPGAWLPRRKNSSTRKAATQAGKHQDATPATPSTWVAPCRLHGCLHGSAVFCNPTGIGQPYTHCLKKSCGETANTFSRRASATQR